MSFSDDINKFRKKFTTNYVEIKRKASFDLFSMIAIATPVDKGLLRNNWHVTHGAPDLSSFDDTEDLPVSVIINKIQSELSMTSLEKDIFFTNNLPYAVTIEYDGHSAQAPEGMVRTNITKWDKIVKLNSKKLS